MNRDRFFRELAPFFLKNSGFVVDKSRDTSASVAVTAAFVMMHGLARLDDAPWTDEATERMEAMVAASMCRATKTVHGDPKEFIEELRRHGYDIVSRGDQGIVLDQKLQKRPKLRS